MKAELAVTEQLIGWELRGGRHTGGNQLPPRSPDVRPHQASLDMEGSEPAQLGWALTRGA